MNHCLRTFTLLFLLALLCGGRQARAQSGPATGGVYPSALTIGDSLAWERVRAEAAADTAFRIEVSLLDRRLWLIDGLDTLRSAPVAIGRDLMLEHGERSWRFRTPRGRRTVLGKEADPVWVPPDWHYVEAAREQGLALVPLNRGSSVPLPDGSRLTIRRNTVGRVLSDGSFRAIPRGEEIVYGDTLFVPPLGTTHRRIPGELGRYKLDMGDGYLIHGTPDQGSIGDAVTHGCIRVGEQDLRALYTRVPVGTPVYIY